MKHFILLISSPHAVKSTFEDKLPGHVISLVNLFFRFFSYFLSVLIRFVCFFIKIRALVQTVETFFIATEIHPSDLSVSNSVKGTMTEYYYFLRKLLATDVYCLIIISLLKFNQLKNYIKNLNNLSSVLKIMKNKTKINVCS